MPGLSGLDLQRELVQPGVHIPIVFMTGHGDIPMTVRAMKAGAVEFLTKPVRKQDLLDAIRAAIDRDRASHAERRELRRAARALRAAHAARARGHGARGRGALNKQIAQSSRPPVLWRASSLHI